MCNFYIFNRWKWFVNVTGNIEFVTWNDIKTSYSEVTEDEKWKMVDLFFSTEDA